jgi:WD40 repeat protein
MSDTRTDASPLPRVIGYELFNEERRDPLGVVYRAKQLLYDREVSLRLVDERALAGGRNLTEVCHDAREVSRLNHPDLVRLREVGDSEGQVYLASDPPPGPSLRQHLARAPLPGAKAAALVAATARIVHHLHDYHALHLGLTSAGVFLVDGSPRLGDLGLAGLLHNHPGVPYPGDAAYAAPEQLAGKKADTRADVYGLGCLLFECLTGRPPYVGANEEETARLAAAGKHPSVHELNRECPPALEKICSRALAHRPDRRYANTDDLAEDLDRYQRGELSGPGPVARVAEWLPHHTMLAAAAAAVVLAALFTTLVGVVFSRRTADARADAQAARREAEQAATRVQAARDEAKEAARKADGKARAAEDKVILAKLQTDRQRQRAFQEEKQRLIAEKLAREQAEGRASAEEATKKAEEARSAAVTARAEAARRLDRLLVGQGAVLLETDDLCGALGPFVRALAVARREKLPEDAHRLRIAALLSRCPHPLSVLCYKKGELDAAQLSLDGRRLLTVGGDGVVVARTAATGKLLGKRLVHGAAVPQATFSPDGKRILSADAQGRLRMWNVEDGSSVFDPVTLEGVPVHLGFSGDGSRFVTITQGRDASSATAVVRDAGGGDAAGEPITTPVAPRPGALSPDGRRLVLCCTDRAARLFDVRTGKQIGPTLGHSDAVLFATFSPNGSRILTATAGAARVWDAANGKPLLAPLESDSSHILPQMDESGRLVLTADKDGAVRVHSVATGRQVGRTLRARSALTHAALSPDGRHALLAGIDGAARVFDVLTGEATQPPLWHGGPLRYLAFSPDGSRALTFDGRTVRVHDLTAGEPLGPAAPAEDGVLSPEGTRLAKTQGDTVQVYDLATGKPVGAAMKHKGEVAKVVFAPGGDRLLTASNPADATAGTPSWDVRVWEAGTGKPLTDVMEHLREVGQASFSRDGSRVLTVALDKRARVWDAKTGKLIGQAMDHAEDVLLAVLSPDGKYVVTSDKENMTRAWNAATGERVGEGMGNAKPVRFVAFSPDGKSLATCCEDGLARTWEVATGKRLFQGEHAGAVVYASFSPDGKLLLTAGADATARVWDLEKGKEHVPPLRHAGPVQRTAFSADGRWLLTASGRFIHLWDGRTGEPLGPGLLHSRQAGEVTDMALSKAGALTSEAGPGTRWTRTLAAEGRSDADLADLARVLSGREESVPGRLAPVGVGELESAWDHLQARHAGDFDPPRKRLLAWAKRGARECEARGLWAGAVRHLDVLLQEGATPPLYARRAKARAEMGQYEGARADYDKALEKGSQRWEWLAGRGAVLASLGRWEQAAGDYGRAARQEERRPELWQKLGEAEARRGQWKKAAEALAKAVRYGGNDPAVWYEHALAQLSAGDRAGYRKSCARMVKKFAGQAATAEACVLGPDALADFKALVERAEKAVLDAPDGVAERARLAALLLRAGQAERAATLLEKCVAGEGARPGDLWLLVLAHHKAGKADRPREALAKAKAAKHPEGATWQERQAAALWRGEAEAVASGD